jgi:hypothetical protein
MTLSATLETASRKRLPLALKLALTGFVAFMIPVYWQTYGPTNFLYFCDAALFLALVAVWTEYPLPAGMAACGILIPQLLWAADFLGTLLGHPVVNMTGYMFKQDDTTLLARRVSLFHGWLPFVLLYLVWRLGYDRRSLAAWTALAWVLMLIGFFFLPLPPAPADNPNLPVNVNYVYGLPDDRGVQTWMPQWAWLAFVMTALPVLFFIPTHFLLRLLMPKARQKVAAVQAMPQPAPGVS